MLNVAGYAVKNFFPVIFLIFVRVNYRTMLEAKGFSGKIKRPDHLDLTVNENCKLDIPIRYSAIRLKSTTTLIIKQLLMKTYWGCFQILFRSY
jgi:hypothetical protein